MDGPPAFAAREKQIPSLRCGMTRFVGVWFAAVGKVL